MRGFAGTTQYENLSRATVDEWRRAVWQRFGLLPERPPLEWRTINEERHADFILETVRYQLEAGEWAESYIARPLHMDSPQPAVLSLHAHGGEYRFGKEKEFRPNLSFDGPFRFAGEELVRRGYVVMAPDQICFGVRNWTKSGSSQHLAMHERFEEWSRLARGGSLIGKIGYDISRAVDVLCTRADVIPGRIGAIGQSGGGCATYTAMLYDPRIVAGVANCGLSSAVELTRAYSPDFSMNLLPDLARIGDRALAVGTMLPRAILLSKGSEDFGWPLAGICDTYYRAAKAYRAFGVEERCELMVFEGGHSFDQPIREQGYRWLKETPISPAEVWYANQRPDPQSLPAADKLRQRAIELVSTYSDRIPEAHPRKRGTFALAGQPGVVVREVRINADTPVNPPFNRSALPLPDQPDDALVHARGRAFHPPVLDLLVATPEDAGAKRLPATICLHRATDQYEHGCREVMGLVGNPWFAAGPALAAQGRIAVAFDLPGHAGRQNPLTGGLGHGTCKHQGFHLVDAGSTLLGRTIHDVRCAVAWLKTRDDVDPGRISIMGFGTGGLVALVAASVMPELCAVVAVGGVATAAALIECQSPIEPFLTIPGLVPAGDVPALLGGLAPRPCTLVAFRDDPHWPAAGAREVFAPLPKLKPIWRDGMPGAGPPLFDAVLNGLSQ